LHDDQVSQKKEHHDDTEDDEPGAIKELALLGSAYEAHSQEWSG
jgi:hypothetical protein